MHVAETCRQISRCRHATKDEDITWHRSRKRRWPVNCSRCFPVWNCTNLVFIETKDTQRWIKFHTHIFKQSYFNCASKWRNRLIWSYTDLFKFTILWQENFKHGKLQYTSSSLQHRVNLSKETQLQPTDPYSSSDTMFSARHPHKWQNETWQHASNFTGDKSKRRETKILLINLRRLS